jgi:predicted Zn-dependent protease
LYKPFFHALSTKAIKEVELISINGGIHKLIANLECPKYYNRLELKMGSPETGCNSSNLAFSMPKDFNLDAALRELKLVSDEAFWESVDAFDDMVSLVAGNMIERRGDFFYWSPAQPARYIGESKKFNIDLKEIQEKLKLVSRHLATLDSKVYYGEAKFRAEQIESYLVNSDGTKIYSDFVRFGVSINVEYLDKKNGFLVPADWRTYVPDQDELPSLDLMVYEAEKVLEDAKELVHADFQNNGELPAILDPEVHGVHWHEVVGHSLEADGMVSDSDGDVGSSIFYGWEGKRVAPEFISLYDDPTIVGMDGHFLYDDEGVEAKRTTLIENGVLTGLLHSRETAGFFKIPSNGHSRAEGNQIPAPRMSNILVESSNQMPLHYLKEELMKIVRNSGTDYGLMMEGTFGGWTSPEDAVFTTYPAKVFRLYPNGKQERVRSVSVVGTPHAALNNIVMTSDEFGVFSGSCGSESGWVPSAEKAPHALVRALEINSVQNSMYAQVFKSAMPMPRFRK